MYIGSPYMRLNAGTAVPINSPTFARGGLAGLFGIEVLALAGTSTTFECDIEHKNLEDTSFSTAASFTSITAAGLATKDVSSLKEQVRLVFRVGGSAAANVVYANVLAPMWRPY